MSELQLLMPADNCDQSPIRVAMSLEDSGIANAPFPDAQDDRRQIPTESSLFHISLR